MLDFENPHCAELLSPLVDRNDLNDNEVYRRTHALRDTLKSINRGNIRESQYAFDVADGTWLIKLAASGRLPYTRTASAAKEILWFMEPFADPAFVDAIRDSYPDCPAQNRRDLLMLLSGQEQKLAAACMRELLTEHGLPQGNHPRTFSKLEKRTKHLHEYVRPLIERAGEDIGYVVDLVNHAIGTGNLEPSVLTPLAPSIETTTRGLLEWARLQQASVKDKWRLDEDYFYLRQRLCAWLDLLGTVTECNIKILCEAESLEDPLISLNVAAALLKRGRKPGAGVIERAARSHETRADLYRVLGHQNELLDLFPSEFASFEQFAASEMVRWLLYPAELGYEPPEIELMATVDAPPGPKGELRRWCLWRFTDVDGNTFAGVSGPYGREALESPSPYTVKSSDVFSSFNEWGAMSAEKHVAGMLDNLTEWRIDFRSRCGD